ncbi:MAG TPA: alkaline phosphatase family protein [Polyangiaceae bacterium]|nr:alkaline phosphatase family protein [Polyangiaceae bacterium]
MSFRHCGPLGLLLLLGCSAQRVLTSTNDDWAGTAPGADKIERVLLISIDGFHASDLTRYLESRPDSTLARLAKLGVRYTKAAAPFPSDSFPGVLAWATGGTPRSTGVFYDISYDRSLAAPGSDCSTLGTVVDFSETVDVDSSQPDGGGGINPSALPRDPAAGCTPIFPHQYLRVNTLFEVLHDAGRRSAWSDKHLSYDVLRGPSGNGVDDLFDPEISAVQSKVVSEVQKYDASKLEAVVRQIHGQDHAGHAASVPAFFGMNFQSVSAMQKAYGYEDAAGTPSDQLAAAIDGVDDSLKTLVNELDSQKLWASTLLIIGASHGQSPIDRTRAHRLPVSLIPGLVSEVGSGLLAAATQDAVALLWLTDSSQAPAVAEHLLANKEQAGIDHVIFGSELSTMFGDPALDSRVPDVVVVVVTGTIYTDSGKKLAEHGGMSDDDRNVALLVVGGSPTPNVIDDPIETRQIAPTVLSALGLAPTSLKAVGLEQTSVLPGLQLTQ